MFNKLRSEVNSHGRMYNCYYHYDERTAVSFLKSFYSASYYEEYEDKPVRSYKLDDDDDESLPFSMKIKEISISNNFGRPKIEKYSEQKDPMYHLNEHMTQMNLKKANPTLKCQPSTLYYLVRKKMVYSKLILESIRS